LLALARYRDWSELVPYDGARIAEAATLGVQWLLKLQNKDGGWPTFCRGWGKLPFDRSGTDLTAHALRALQAWSKLIVPKRYVEVVHRGFEFLDRRQNADGSWTPLWFGNQDHPQEENPVYGTAKVLAAYRAFGRGDTPAARRARAWLAGAQQSDGGWGTAGGRSRPGADIPAERRVSSVEETSLAVESLVGEHLEPELQPVAVKGLRWLIEAVESGRHLQSAPIGLYFAKLWYDERLYPVTFAASALRAAVQSPLVAVGDHAPAVPGGNGPPTTVRTTGGVAQPMPDP
jgi:squalene-hopene/tetraprenyl-beta-curcumene cyclase